MGQGLCGAVGPGWAGRAVLEPWGHLAPLLSLAKDAVTHPCSESDPSSALGPWSIPGSVLGALFALPKVGRGRILAQRSGCAPPQYACAQSAVPQQRDLALSARLPASSSMSNDTNVLLTLSPALGRSPGRSQAPLSLLRLCFTSEQLPSVCLSPLLPPTQLPDGVKCPKAEASQAGRLQAGLGSGRPLASHTVPAWPLCPHRGDNKDVC